MKARIIGGIKKIWGSPTCTQFLNLLTKPLRLFLLTPLVLTHFSVFEIDLFYIIASCAGVSAIISTTIPSVFLPLMVYFKEGGSVVSQYGLRSTQTVVLKNTPPNWKGFSDCLVTAGRLQLILFIPVVILIVSFFSYGLHRQIGVGFESGTVSSSVLILIATACFDLFYSRYIAAVRALQKVALVNRLELGYSIATIVISSVAILFSAGLVAVLAIQLAFNVCKRAHLRFFLEKSLPNTKIGVYSPEIMKALSKPLVRACSGAISYGLIEKLWPVLAIGIMTKGDFVAMSIGLALSSTLRGAASANVLSQGPRFTKVFSQGDILNLKFDCSKRVVVSLLLLSAGLVVVGPFYSLFLQLVGSKVEFMSISDWFVLALLQLLVQMQGLLMYVYNVTNQRPFYLRQIVGVLVTLACLVIIDSLTTVPLPLSVVAALLFVPRILTLGSSPTKMVMNLLQCSIFDFLRSGFKGACEFQGVRRFLS